jgi:hypothetical protein
MKLFIFGLLKTHHWFPEVFADVCENGRVLVVRDGLDHGVGSLLWVVALEDAGADKAAVDTQLHQHGHVGRSR